MSGWGFYLIQTTDTRNVKYGITKDWESRILAHQNSQAEPLKILCRIPCDDGTHARIVERNFAGTTRRYATGADNEWRTKGVMRTKAARDPLSCPAQCVNGHLWPDDSAVYFTPKQDLPMCRACRLDNKRRHDSKKKARRAADPEYDAQCRTKATVKSQQYRAQYPDMQAERGEQFRVKQKHRRDTDPEYRAKHNERSREYSKNNRDKRNATQRAYRARDPEKARERKRAYRARNRDAINAAKRAAYARKKAETLE